MHRSLVELFKILIIMVTQYSIHKLLYASIETRSIKGVSQSGLSLHIVNSVFSKFQEKYILRNVHITPTAFQSCATKGMKISLGE